MFQQLALLNDGADTIELGLLHDSAIELSQLHDGTFELVLLVGGTMQLAQCNWHCLKIALFIQVGQKLCTMPYGRTDLKR